MKPPILTVQLPKGGVGKTATAVALAEAAAEAGAPVMLVDSDPQGSATRWAQLAEHDERPLRSHVVGLASRDLAGRLPVMAAGYGCVVVDGPPGDLAIVRSAVTVADLVVMPVPPRAGDADRVPGLVKLAADAGVPILAVQTFARANSVGALAAREALTESGVLVADATLPTSEPIARQYGQRPRGRLAAFGRDLLAEILDRHLHLGVQGGAP